MAPPAPRTPTPDPGPARGGRGLLSAVVLGALIVLGFCALLLVQHRSQARLLELAGWANESLAACGFPLTGTIQEQRDIAAAARVIRTAPGPVLYVAKVRAEPPFALPPKDGAHLKDRFRQALLGSV